MLKNKPFSLQIGNTGNVNLEDEKVQNELKQKKPPRSKKETNSSEIEVNFTYPFRFYVFSHGSDVFFWGLTPTWRGSPTAEVPHKASFYWLSALISLISKKTGSIIFCSGMKSSAAILVGPIQYTKIPQGAAFFFDDCWNVMNAQRETE